MRSPRLRNLRRCRNWSQEELAAVSGVSRSLIAMAETGKRGLIMPAADRIAAAFGLTADELRGAECRRCDSSPEAVFTCLAHALKAAA